jgi:hypothetical protein
MISVKNAIGFDDYAVGVAWDYNAVSPVLRRWFMAGGFEQTIDFDANPFNHLEPWKSMVRQNQNDAGEVTARFGDAGYAEDGSNGQVTVPINSFYYRKWRDTANGRMIMAVSPKAINGFKLHPIGINNSGKLIPRANISAFEGVAQKISDLSYYEDADDADPVALDDSLYMLASVAGYKPKSYQQLPEFRTMCNNRGSTWHQYRMVDHFAIQLLNYIEFASLDSQGSLGQGIVSKASGSYNEAEKTDSNHGAWSYSLEYPSYGVTTDGLHAVVYRGIENPWGNIWKWCDNCIITGDGYYMGIGVSPNDTGSGYQFIGEKPLGWDGYVYNYFTDILDHPDLEYAFFPTNITGGGNNKFFCDYHYSYYPGITVAPRVGGYWYYGLRAGVGLVTLYYHPSTRNRSFSGRLLQLPN